MTKPTVAFVLMMLFAATSFAHDSHGLKVYGVSTENEQAIESDQFLGVLPLKHVHQNELCPDGICPPPEATSTTIVECDPVVVSSTTTTTYSTPVTYTYSQPVYATTYSNGRRARLFNGQGWYPGKLFGVMRTNRMNRRARWSARSSMQYGGYYGYTPVSSASYSSTGGGYYNARWTWPGMTEEALRRHGAGGPHWWDNVNSMSFNCMKRQHDIDHDNIGPYSASMIRAANMAGPPVRTSL